MEYLFIKIPIKKRTIEENFNIFKRPERKITVPIPENTTTGIKETSIFVFTLTKLKYPKIDKNNKSILKTTRMLTPSL